MNPGRFAGASGTTTIVQFFSCDPSRYFLSRSSAAWLPTGSKAAFFERDTVTLPSDPTREKNLLNILLPPGRDCTVQPASESTCVKGLPSLPTGCPVTTHSKPGIQTTVVCTRLSFLPSGKSMSFKYLIADAVGVVERPANKGFCVARLSKPFIDVPWGRDEIKYLIRRPVDNYMVFDKDDVGVVADS